MKIFIDSDAFIALLNKTDALHQKAKNLLSTLNQIESSEFYTSWDVIDEVATKISYHLTKKQAIKFLNYLQKIQACIIYPDAKLAKQAQNLFKSLIPKRVSMADCMNVIITKELQLDCIFSFDKIYQKQGVKLLKNKLEKYIPVLTFPF